MGAFLGRLNPHSQEAVIAENVASQCAELLVTGISKQSPTNMMFWTRWCQLQSPCRPTTHQESPWGLWLQPLRQEERLPLARNTPPDPQLPSSCKQALLSPDLQMLRVWSHSRGACRRWQGPRVGRQPGQSGKALGTLGGQERPSTPDRGMLWEAPSWRGASGSRPAALGFAAASSPQGFQ